MSTLLKYLTERLSMMEERIKFLQIIKYDEPSEQEASDASLRRMYYMLPELREAIQQERENASSREN